MKRIISLALAALLVVCLFTGCDLGKGPDMPTTTPPVTDDPAPTEPDPTELPPVTDPTEGDITTDPSAVDVNGIPSETTATTIATESTVITTTGTTKAGETTTTAKPTTTTRPVPGTTTTTRVTTTADVLPTSKADIAAAYNEAVEKAYNANGQVKKVSTVKIDKPLDADEGLTKLLALDIGGFNVLNAVCGLLGEKNKEEKTQAAKDQMKKSTLGASDLSDAKASRDKNGNLVVELEVKGSKNPKKGGSEPIAKFTNDFTDMDDVANGIKDAEKTVPGLKIIIEKKTFEYKNIKIKATISPDGKLVSMTHSYTYTGVVEDVTVKELFVTLGSGKKVSGKATGTFEFTF